MRVYWPLVLVFAFLGGAGLLLWAWYPVVSVLAWLGGLLALWAANVGSVRSPCCNADGLHLGGTAWRCGDCGRPFTFHDFGE